MSEIEAKVRYVKLARSLKTYGVSFFLVKVGSGPFLLLSLFLTLALSHLSKLLQLCPQSFLSIPRNSGNSVALTM